ncbi:MAG: TCR/Tet family MFS transporter [Gammaproteobacteria bacterium]|nr:TCR/Tet family MFS transporter [Gammaproteobacteria bacterium]
MFSCLPSLARFRRLLHGPARPSLAGRSPPPRVPLALAKRGSSPALAFIFITVLIDILSFGIIIPVLPHLVEQLSGGQIGRAAVWVGAMQTMFAAIQFFASPLQGAASDRWGRRRVILVSNMGLGVDFAVMALAPSLWLLFVGRAVSAMTAASFSTANAYIADVTPPQRRAGAYGLLGAAFGIGFVVGPAIGGLLGSIGPRAPFWAAAGLSLTNFCYGLWVLPESLPPERRSRRFRLREANPWGALLLLRRYPRVFSLALLVFITQLAHYVLQSTFVLYTDFRYGWGPREVGATLALVGLCSGLVSAVLVGRAVVRFGERATLLAGLACGVLGLVWMGLAGRAAAFVAAVPLIALWGLSEPPAQSLMSARVPPDQQGRLQGTLASLLSFAGIFGPALFTNVFAVSIAGSSPDLPGAAFLLAAALLVVGGAVAWRVARPPPATVAGVA